MLGAVKCLFLTALCSLSSEHYIEQQEPAGSLTVDESSVFTYEGQPRHHVRLLRGGKRGATPANMWLTLQTAPYCGRRARSKSPVTQRRLLRQGATRNANKYGRTGAVFKALMTGYAAASLPLTLKTTKASMWDSTVFVFKVRHDFVGEQINNLFRSTAGGATKWGISTRNNPGIEGKHRPRAPPTPEPQPSTKIVIPWHLRSTETSPKAHRWCMSGGDASGHTTRPVGGEWGAYLPGLTADPYPVPEGINASGVSLSGHRHGGVEPGSSTTSRQQEESENMA